MNQKVINFVNQLKNSSLVNHKELSFNYSQLILEYVDCLYREGFIQSYELKESQGVKEIRVLTRTENGYTLTSGIKIVSSLTKKRFLTAKDIQELNLKKKELFLSTSDGIYSLSECKRKKVGGLAIFAC